MTLTGGQGLAILFGAIGIAALIAGAYTTVLQLDFLSRCSEATAVVVDFTIVDQGFAPVFQFVDSKTGTNVTATGSISHTPSLYSVGQEVSILYDPENLAAQVTVNSFFDIWIGPLLFLGVGGAMTLTGVLISMLETRKKRNLPANRF